MGFFASFRKPSASSLPQEDDVQREWRHIEETERKEQRNAEKIRKQEAKKILNERKKQQRKELKRMKRAEKQIKKAEKERIRAVKKELDAVNALMNQTQKESRKKEKETKKQINRLKRTQKAQERARKRAIRQQQRAEKKRQQRQVQYDMEQRQLESALEHQRMELAQSTVVVNENNVHGTQPPLFKKRLFCTGCHVRFVRVPTRSRHHCRNCGDSFCSRCLSSTRRVMPWIQLDTPQRICLSCEERINNTTSGVSNHETVEHSVTIPQRSSSLSEQPVSESETNSPTSGQRVRIRLRSRSSSSSKSGKKSSIWNLPIRPLLKRKESVDQLRNRAWDLDLQLDKAQQVAKMNSKARVLDIKPLQPLLASAS